MSGQGRSEVEMGAHRLLVGYHKSQAIGAAEWATLALAAGHDGTHLRMLASMEPSSNWFEVRDYIRPALEESGIPFLSANDAVVEFARDVACMILRGEISPRSGCSMLSRLAIDMDYPSELMTWYGIDDDYDLAAEGYISGKNLDAEVRQAAVALAPECANPNDEALSTSPQAIKGWQWLSSFFSRK